MKHVCMMNACVMHVKNGDEGTDQPTNEQGDSRSMIAVLSYSIRWKMVLKTAVKPIFRWKIDRIVL